MKPEVLVSFDANASIKFNATAYSESGRAEDLDNLLMQLVIQTKLNECGAPAPMTDAGVIMFIAPYFDDEGRQWMPLFTDLDEVFSGDPKAYSVVVPIRDIVEEAFERGVYEGLLVNPYSDRVFLGKCELDRVLDTVMRLECKE